MLTSEVLGPNPRIEDFVSNFDKRNFRQKAEIPQDEPLFWVKLDGHTLEQLGAKDKSIFDIFIATRPSNLEEILEVNKTAVFRNFFDLEGQRLPGGTAGALLLQVIY